MNQHMVIITEAKLPLLVLLMGSSVIAPGSCYGVTSK